MAGIGVGFDGKKFIFTRFVPSPLKQVINTSKVKLSIKEPLNLAFVCEEKDFLTGLKRLSLLIRQTDKMTLSKEKLCAVLSPKQDYVRESISVVYENLLYYTSPDGNFNNRVKTLYDEWDRVFGECMEKMTRQLILQKYHLKSEKCMGLVSRKILIVKNICLQCRLFLTSFLSYWCTHSWHN